MTRVPLARSYTDLGEALLMATLLSIYLGSRGAAQALGVAQRLASTPLPPPS